MTAFWGLFALVHWVDIRGSFQPGIGPAIDTVPFALYLAVGVLRQKSERRRPDAMSVALQGHD